ncbi:PPOX class F420-dependent oxidoreductase [Amycolatopsis magusensis]|uniref:PPOX class F420-dependent oxidoreductase n=1 Tax=Amycolatopsis magusensis TaxID=882444 RepID=UPI0024A7C82A|nr:PPOX class F420-dependent oxidoreductase [Amycolatopsis magusensis]MDI5981567.1 PPOX class F420-dependent oxidoreductase [Amycolatopsis magusensis]
MSFTEAELAFLSEHDLGRMATLQPGGALQVSPVGFHYDTERGTIEVRGFNLAKSRKFKNIAENGRVAIVVDDRPSLDPPRVRCLEIRGRAEAVTGIDPEGHLDGSVIRIHPERIISFGIDEPDTEPHQLTANNRNVVPR